MKLIDWLSDLPFHISLWLADLVVGPEPQTRADRIRETRRERLRKAFPGPLPEDRQTRGKFHHGR
jgi:hypothetical protein